MNWEEFDQKNWKAGEEVVFNGASFPVVSLDFPERLIGIREFPETDPTFISWKRCENVRAEK